MTSTFTRRRGAGSRGHTGDGERRPEPPHDVRHAVVDVAEDVLPEPGRNYDADEHFEAGLAGNFDDLREIIPHR
jgi:hypothetical protein